MVSVRARVASLNVTRALRCPLPANAAGTWTRNSGRVRVASQLPSSVNTTRLISRPRTVAVNPSLHGVRELGVRCVSAADSLLLGKAEWLGAVGVAPDGGGVVPGGVDPGGDVVEVPHMEPSMTLLF